MFRQMRRSRQELPRQECLQILKDQPRGVLSLLGDGDYPYGLPMDYWYCEEDGNIYFHCGQTGHKIDALKKHDKVSFCVYEPGCRKEGDWALTIRSVIVFGRIHILEDPGKRGDILRNLSRKFTDDTAFIEDLIQKYAHEALCLALTPEHISGKTVHEA